MSADAHRHHDPQVTEHIEAVAFLGMFFTAAVLAVMILVLLITF